MKCDDSQTTMSNTKKDEEEEGTQLDDSNVRVGNDALVRRVGEVQQDCTRQFHTAPLVSVTVLFRNCQTEIWTV